MRCQFCHNPDTWDIQVGQEKSADELLAQALRYKSYWKDEGGITVSGGEPLLQMDFLIELFRKAKEQGINTTIDTSGAPFTREEPFFGKFNELMKYTDLLLVDIKHIDNEQHKRLTGHTNENILDMAQYLSEIKKPVWIRHVLVPERNDIDEYLKKLYNFIKKLNNVKKVEVLPYHTFGEYKWKELGYEYSLVLGSEKYYPRFGYLPAVQFGIKVPEGIPSINFMAIQLQEHARPISGAVTYAKEFGI